MAAPANLKIPPQMANMMKKPETAGSIAKTINLNGLIKTVKVLNRSDEDSTISDMMFGANTNITEAQYIMSDADEELLILYEFKEDVDLDSISLHACMTSFDAKDNDDEDEELEYSPPKQIFIYKVDSLNKDFEDALAAKPDLKIVGDRNKLKSKQGQTVKIKKKAKLSVKFGKLDKLMVFIPSNLDDVDKTYISGIKFEGNSSAKTDMSRWNDVKCKS
eukprot:CAMPEP_0197023112 /NCGR_PEP_ID=MMETSP1384-20130603/3903_1 /TAXON_ID=29189 /ORGANISM="Ammonia sp." /LENGTH=218 /DNA_ID=CAMNT_0042451281 /DNA_START=51 /DNA_END=707 /DNA_ORIENTATION=+